MITALNEKGLFSGSLNGTYSGEIAGILLILDAISRASGLSGVGDGGRLW